MFDADNTQKKAFADAANNVSIERFNHSILYMLGALATIWLLMVFVGVMRNKEKSPFQVMQEFSYAIFIYLLIGLVVVYKNP